MSLSSAIQGILSRIDDWWKDREDERLDEIVALDYEPVRNKSSDPGMVAYQLVKRARNSRNGS